MKSLFFFDTMITPRIITFVCWLLLFVALVGGIGAMFSLGRSLQSELQAMEQLRRQQGAEQGKSASENVKL